MLEAYASKITVAAGDSLDLMVSSDRASSRAGTARASGKDSRAAAASAAGTDLDARCRASAHPTAYATKADTATAFVAANAGGRDCTAKSVTPSLC
jgi:hypothetical protein